MSLAPPPRVIAVDWSGARERTEQRRRIWLAEARDGVLVRLECGRDRDRLVRHLIDEAAADPRVVVGLDFSFSLPAWHLRETGVESAPDLWARAAERGEEWLTGCDPPFWGRAGRRRPASDEPYRRTERGIVVAGIRPKSTFQVAGAGSVGTGSLRGMPALLALRDAGFAVWPFDAARLPLAVEIYPRLLTGAVNKSSYAARIEHLRTHFPALTAGLGALAVSNDDAFDAAVSAMVMAEHAADFEALEPAEGDDRLEGAIWEPTGVGSRLSAMSSRL